MAGRTVTDSNGRTWMCVAEPLDSHNDAGPMGKDVVLSCSTPSVAEPARVTVGWQWETMSDNGLARIVSLALVKPER